MDCMDRLDDCTASGLENRVHPLGHILGYLLKHDEHCASFSPVLSFDRFPLVSPGAEH